MRLDQLTPEARRQLAFAAEQLRVAGISIDEETILSSAQPAITIEPRTDKLSELSAEWAASPAPRNRHERRKAAALSRRS